MHYIAADFFNYKDEFRLALIKVLFDQKADADAIDNHGRTALHDLLETWQNPPFSFAKKFEAITELFFQQDAQPLLIKHSLSINLLYDAVAFHNREA